VNQLQNQGELNLPSIEEDGIAYNLKTTDSSKRMLTLDDPDIQYNLSSDYDDYIFEGVSEYEVFKTALNKVQRLEQYI
tara:strand:+ start:48 stop:281 length:234 start_codon:yes stop_codon:yes gene_type:complete